MSGTATVVGRPAGTDELGLGGAEHLGGTGWVAARSSDDCFPTRCPPHVFPFPFSLFPFPLTTFDLIGIHQKRLEFSLH